MVPHLPDESKLCFAVYVHGAYGAYVPIFIASVLTSYPDAFVKVFVHDAEPSKEAMELVAARISQRYAIINWSDLPVKEPKHKRAARWFLPATEFADFRYVYVGDVDFVIVREPDGITAPHRDHGRTLGVPYSNVVRSGTRRLTGLHFIDVAPYYEKMAAVLDKYRQDAAFLERGNESILYDLVEEGIGIPLQRIREHWYRPHHGLHLGLARGRQARGLLNSKYWAKCREQFRGDRTFLDLIQLCRAEHRLLARFCKCFLDSA